MNIRNLNRLLGDPGLVSEKLEQYEKEKALLRQKANSSEIAGHLLKADSNLKFVADNIPLKHYDWCITGCYYAIYHAAIALALLRGYSSKSHDATLCVLIKEYYRKGMGAEEIEMLNRFFLDYQEIVFYVESKQKREDATYSTSLNFDKTTVDKLRIRSSLFIDKAKKIIGNG